PTIPCEQKITFVKRGNGQMQCITSRIGRHHFMPNVRLNNLSDLRFDRQEWQLVEQGNSHCASFRITPCQLGDDCCAANQFVARRSIFPPLPRPIPSRYDIRLRTQLVVEAWNGRFDIYPRLNHESVILPHILNPSPSRRGTSASVICASRF